MKPWITALLLTFFITGQVVGLGFLAAGHIEGIVSIFGSALAGFSGMAGVLDKNW